MINLIPPIARKKITREYWVRVTTVWLFMISSAFLIMIILQIPTYLLIQTQLDVFDSQIREAQSAKEAFRNSEESILFTNRLVDHFSGTTTDSIQFYELLKELDSVASNGITLTQFLFQKNDVVTIELFGKASTRTVLAAFRDDIKKHELFSDVHLPISNLAKDRDIVFSMEITLTTENKN